MRIASILLVSLLFLGCYNPQIEILGKWYASNFGIIIITTNCIKFYPINSPPETWNYDEKVNSYKYEGTIYKHCQMNQDSNLLIRAKLVGSQTINIYSSNRCLFKTPFTNELILHRIPDDMVLDFNYLSLIQFKEGKFDEIRISPNELDQPNTSCGSFSTEEMLWIMFSSGVIKDSTADRFETIALKLVGEGLYLEKRVRFVELPCYLKELIVNIN